MVIDVCLVTSMLVMAFRFAKGTRVHTLLPKIVEMEGRISVMMAEIEGRAKHVSDQLIRREQNLSRYIAEIEKHQKDAGVALSDGDALSKELALLCESARREALELERAIAEFRSAQNSQADSSRQARRSRPRRSRSSDLVESSQDDFTDQVALPNAAVSTARGAKQRGVGAHNNTRENRPNTEIFVQDKPATVQSLQESYRSAEDMLKRGRNVEEVSERTNLPIEGVRRLAQMIEIEREEGAEVPVQYPAGRVSADPRLGALGLSRR